MEEVLNGVNEQEIAEPVDAASEAEEVETIDTGEEAPSPSEAPAKPPQTKEENAAFAHFRREKEAAEQRAREYEEALKRVGGAYGYDGSDPLYIADKLAADAQQISVEEYRKNQAREQETLRQRMMQDPLYRQTVERAQALEQVIAAQSMEQDLKRIKEAHPEEQAKSLFDLGETFAKLVAGGIDALTAYDAVRAETQRNTSPIPPKPGKVQGNTAKTKDFYTPEEVDQLTEKQLDDPKIMDTVMKSMTKWRK